MTNINNIIDYINGSNDFVVTSHISPDGDNIGSTLSMYYSLKKLGKNVCYVLDDQMPLNMQFLIEGVEILKSSECDMKDYTLISLDCGDRPRICVSDEIKDNAVKLICIDHHASNEAFGDLNYIDVDASSTCELMYNVLVRMSEVNNIDFIDAKVATALYTGLVTDTGNFAYSNTHASSFEMAKELLIKGAKKDTVIQNVFQSNPYNYYKLLGEALNTLDIVDGKVASISITKEMLKENAISFNDLDGITPYTRDIQGVEVGILIKEKKENEVKVSLRSKNYVNVSEIAKVFGGGGHVRASGCTIFDSVENAKAKVLEQVLKTI
ncbi:bifunctional oligoribonuclease/PAP phosphatase NrnA [Romboutsia weinsteinii]|uniref:Bifunctional oligoribonuclease/PAP phosphatase NrnA n=1 Tax=Romboutsia weinsteinii TaxID=2020949 RepID=A0A371J2K2_9FIRM|nr:bifunctional oligoribonuclease/PAP phosphatase NrnA [Romboutsia weinsteinii]